MRKALIGLMMAATVMTPIAAEAQNRGERGRERAERVQRQETRQAPERRQQRSERREARQEQRQQRREVQVQRQQVQRQQQAQSVQRQRSERRSNATRPGSAYPQAWQGDPNSRMRRHYEELERRNQYRYGTREQREQVRREAREDRRDWRDERRDRRDWRNDRRRDWNRDWNRDWRRDNRYDWQNWRYRNRNVFRGWRYYSPYRNHRYTRFGIGFQLQPLFYSQRYWLSDPYMYRLPPAPPGTQWVRYYNDVLLVDTWTGEVIDVLYDFFW